MQRFLELLEVFHDNYCLLLNKTNHLLTPEQMQVKFLLEFLASLYSPIKIPAPYFREPHDNEEVVITSWTVIRMYRRQRLNNCIWVSQKTSGLVLCILHQQIPGKLDCLLLLQALATEQHHHISLISGFNIITRITRLFDEATCKAKVFNKHSRGPHLIHILLSGLWRIGISGYSLLAGVCYLQQTTNEQASRSKRRKKSRIDESEHIHVTNQAIAFVDKIFLHKSTIHYPTSSQSAFPLVPDVLFQQSLTNISSSSRLSYISLSFFKLLLLMPRR